MGSLPAILGLVFLFIVFASLNDKFLTTYNMANLVVQAGSICVMAMGIVFVLLIGEIDLSAGVAGGASATIIALMLIDYDWTWWAATLAGVAVGAVIGLAIGSLVAFLGIPVLRRHPRLLPRPAGGSAQADRRRRLAAVQRPGAARPVDQERPGHRGVDRGDPDRGRLRRAVAVALPLALGARGWSTSPSAWSIIQIAVLAVIVLGLTALLSANRAPNPLLFDISGIPWVLPGRDRAPALLDVRAEPAPASVATSTPSAATPRPHVVPASTCTRVRISAFVICSSMAALSGLLLASYVGKVSPGSGGGNVLLYAVGAAVIGGTSLFGGRGRAIDAVIGGLVIATIPNGLGLLNQASYINFLVTGGGPPARRERRRHLAPPPLLGRRVGPDMTTRRRPGLGTNQELARRHNLGTVLRHVHGAGQISRAELTGLMGLNRSTIAALVNELEALGITERVLPVEGTPRQGAGRPSAGVRVAEQGPFVIAVDLGVDRAVVARIGLGGTGAAAGAGAGAQRRRGVAGGRGRRRADPLRRGEGPRRRAARRHRDQRPRPRAQQRRPDPSRPEPRVARRLVRRHRPGRARPRRARCRSRTTPTSARSPSTSAAWPSGWTTSSTSRATSASAPASSPAGVRLEGAGGYAGEVGHLRFNPAGRECHCGNRGCWETEVGAHAIAEAIHCPADKVAQLDEVLDGFGEPSPALRATGTALGHGLASIVNVFNPRQVVLGGYFRSLYALVGPEVEAGLADRALPAPLESVTLTLPGSRVGLLAPRGRGDRARAPVRGPGRRPRHGARRRRHAARRMSGAADAVTAPVSR